MLKMIRKQMNKKGFTLIELVVVIAILAILAAIAVPQLLGFQDRAREQADKQTAVQVRNALSLLHANGEIEFLETDADTATVTITIDGDVANATDANLVATTSVAVTFDATALTAIEALVFDLIGAVDLQGTVDDIVVTLTKAGTVTVVSP